MKKEYSETEKSLIAIKKEIEKSYKKQHIKELYDAITSIDQDHYIL